MKEDTGFAARILKSDPKTLERADIYHIALLFCLPL